MHIYEVVPLRGGIAFNHTDSDVVVAKSPESAVQLIVNHYNEAAGFECYKESDFEAGSPIEPEKFSEETVIN